MLCNSPSHLPEEHKKLLLAVAGQLARPSVVKPLETLKNAYVKCLFCCWWFSSAEIQLKNAQKFRLKIQPESHFHMHARSINDIELHFQGFFRHGRDEIWNNAELVTTFDDATLSARHAVQLALLMCHNSRYLPLIHRQSLFFLSTRKSINTF